MPSLTVFTNPLTPGICQLPSFSVGDIQNWSLQFNDGTNFYNPTGVSMNIGYFKGLGNLTFSSAFQWVDRMNNIHTGSFAIAAGLPSSLTWDENPIGIFGDNGAWLLRGRVPPSNRIRKVYVKFGGAGLSTAPALRFAGGVSATGQGATATATVSAGAVTAVSIVNPGNGYSATNTPEVIVTGDGTGAVFKVDSTAMVAGKLSSFIKISGGSGYTTATVTIVDPEATATAAVGGTSGVTGVSLANGGMGYTSAPTIAITGGGGSSATATAALANSTWGLSGLTLTAAGSGFTSPPTVGFSGGTGSGAAATAIISGNGGVGSVTITNQGAYNLQNPNSAFGGITVAFSGGGGTGATGTVVLQMSSQAPYYWYVSQIIITAGGSGYTSAPTATFTVADSTITQVVGAAGTSVLTTGTVTGLVLTSAGSGYGATAPTVSFTGGGGSGATATAQLVGSPISPVITVTAAGSGYTSAPAVGFSGGAGSGAAATALVSLGITSVTITQGGFAYTSLPSIITVPDSNAVLIPAGIESHSVAFLQNLVPVGAGSAITVTPFTNGRRDASGNLIYDDSLLIVRPRYISQPTMTLQSDALTWAAVFTPVNAFVNAVLAYRRSVVADLQIFGAGRLLFQGSLTILAA